MESSDGKKVNVADVESMLMAVAFDFLRDTLVVKTSAEAGIYRQSAIEIKGKCPTILSLDGYKILSSGERGGNALRAPSYQDMKFHFSSCAWE